MPIFIEDKLVKLGGVVLPGLFKSMEISRQAAVDEIEVEGSAVSPKQAVGYEDAKVKLELTVDSTGTDSAQSQIAKLHDLFRKKGQTVPQPIELVCKETAAAGIGKVLFEKLSVKRTNKTDQYAVTLEFCQYIPMPIAVSKAKAQTAAPVSPTQQAAAVLSADYQQYLEASRGSAPGKTVLSPSLDDRIPNYFIDHRYYD